MSSYMTSSGNMWHETRLLISGVFITIVAFTWVDAVRGLRDWSLHGIDSSSTRVKANAIFSLLYAIFGVGIAITLILLLVKSDVELTTNLEKVIKFDQTTTTPNEVVNLSEDFKVTHIAQVDVTLSCSFTVSEKMNGFAAIYINNELQWRLDLKDNDYSNGGKADMIRHIPNRNSRTSIIRAEVIGVTPNPTTLDFEFNIVVRDGNPDSTL